ncbi:MAG: tRNA uridine-5-carboxymethylaminomethyl(34) synthesis enzyme MnmG, partial [Thermoflexibacter sp.]|nr:tRNA uridine-5-carboxymethylaminomethyl(34) synthesis enzyme MnmG [Thermoflexibacter sp.]
AATGITEQLVQYGFEAGRMKTGTPPRVDGRTLNYEAMQEQEGDENPSKFSYSDETQPLTKQRSCFITYTNEEVHDILRTGFDRSPMFNGTIKSIGPRYCPSVEDKINRFAERERHQIFVEPEGWNTVEVYVNGFSTSLPEDVQYKALKKIPGFENCRMFRPGYAIEYDFFPPTQLKPTLETMLLENLFFAGQINGTTGYEEAACQGLMAGINAYNKAFGKEEFILSRSEAYIGVLIDDLVHKGTEEPYRMFTSRAEYRILLRQDNADIRLTEKGHKIGLAEDFRLAKVQEKLKETAQIIEFLKNKSISPLDVNDRLREMESAELSQSQKASQLLKRPEMELATLMNMTEGLKQELSKYSEEAMMQAEILVKYDSYIEKEEKLAEKLNNLDNIKLGDWLNYKDIKQLSNEARDKLSKVKPQNLGQASRISGVSPADISVLMVYLNK